MRVSAYRRARPWPAVDALVDALAALLEDPERRSRLGAAGRARIDEKFCWRVCAREMTDYYRGVLANADR